MQFMIDYENVRSAGFNGIEYLQQYDAITLFYSDAAGAIERGI